MNLLKRKLKREREMYDNIEQQVFTINPLALNRDEDDHAATTTIYTVSVVSHECFNGGKLERRQVSAVT